MVVTGREAPQRAAPLSPGPRPETPDDLETFDGMITAATIIDVVFQFQFLSSNLMATWILSENCSFNNKDTEIREGNL